MIAGRIVDVGPLDRHISGVLLGWSTKKVPRGGWEKLNGQRESQGWMPSLSRAR